jgi:hypothetical protein
MKGSQPAGGRQTCLGTTLRRGSLIGGPLRLCTLCASLLFVAAATPGCATCRQSSDAQAAGSTKEAPWRQQVFGFIFGFAANSAYAIGAEEQRIQSGDPTR